jgi:xylan 1,4-beta-xylosidase
LKTGAKPLMSIDIKPRILYPTIDQEQVDPTSYAEWDQLIYEMVRHYNVEKKYGIKYWEVFNETDIGETGGCPSRFTPENYGPYYEHTARAILRADPTAKVGGPALANYHSPILKGLVSYCAAKKVPLNFVSWHIYNPDPMEIKRSILEVKALLRDFPTIHCETILDEWNMRPNEVSTPPAYQPAYTIDTIYQMREAGLDYASHYHIRDYHVDKEQFARFMSLEGALHMEDYWNMRPRYYGIFDFQGVPRPLYFAFKLLSRLSGNRLETTTDTPTVKAMASYDQAQKMINVLVWNFAVQQPSDCPLDVVIGNLPGKHWLTRRILLDSATASNQENDRMRVLRSELLENVSEVKDSFELPGYGVSLISLKQLTQPADVRHR